MQGVQTQTKIKPVYALFHGKSEFLRGFLIPQLNKYQIFDYQHNTEITPQIGIADHTVIKTRSLPQDPKLAWVILLYRPHEDQRAIQQLIDQGTVSIIRLPCQISQIAKIVHNLVKYSPYAHLSPETESNLLRLADGRRLNLSLIKEQGKRFVLYKSRFLTLQEREYRLLAFIITQLKQGVYFADYGTLETLTGLKRSTLRTAISQLRAKLHRLKIPITLKNEYGIGYRIVTYY